MSSDAVLIPLEHKPITSKGPYYVLQYKDYKEEFWDGSKDFYSQPYTIYKNDEIFNPLLDAIGTYNFLDVCNDLYYLEESDVVYQTPTEYKNTVQFFEKKSDGSYVSIPKFDDLSGSTTYYVEDSLSQTISEWGIITNSDKEFSLKVYLNQKVADGITTIDYPDLLKVKFETTQVGGDFVLDDSKWVDLSITHQGITYRGRLNAKSTLITPKTTNTLTNGQFWATYATNDNEKLSLYQEINW